MGLVLLFCIRLLVLLITIVILATIPIIHVHRIIISISILINANLKILTGVVHFITGIVGIVVIGSYRSISNKLRLLLRRSYIHRVLLV